MIVHSDCYHASQSEYSWPSKLVCLECEQCATDFIEQVSLMKHKQDIHKFLGSRAGIRRKQTQTPELAAIVTRRPFASRKNTLAAAIFIIKLFFTVIVSSWSHRNQLLCKQALR